MNKVGITIGKFMPLHKGHELMIEFGSKMMDTLYVLVSDKPGKEIDIRTRYYWMVEFARKRNLHNVKVIYHEDKSPTPVNVDENGTVLDKDFQYYWANEFEKVSTDLTHIVTSDMYGKSLSELMGLEWLPVDPHREMVPVCATDIRNDPKKNFMFLSDVSKDYFVKKIAVVGPESTGKSTMVKKLCGAFPGSALANEYGRTLSEAKDNNLSKDDFISIVNGQRILIESAVTRTDSPYVFIDTEAYTTYLFEDIYLGSLSEELLDLARTQEIDHYIVLAPTVDWVDDGWRVVKDREARIEFFDKMVKFLSDNDFSYTVIDAKKWNEREQQAIEAVNIS